MDWYYRRRDNSRTFHGTINELNKTVVKKYKRGGERFFFFFSYLLE